MKAFLPMVAFFFFPGLSFLEAQGILIGWDLPENSTTNSVVSITNSAGLVGLQSINLGAGLGASQRPGGWGGSWSAGGSEFINNSLDQYFQFQVTAETGKKVIISGISRLSLQASPSGPRYWNLLVSTSNSPEAFTSPTRNYGPFAVSNPPTSVSYNDVSTLISNAVSSNQLILLSGQTAYFRLIGWGGSTNGTGRITSTNTAPSLDFALSGTVEVMSKTSQTISFPSFGRQLLGDTLLTPGASASSGLDISYVSSDPSVAEFSNNSLILKNVGTTLITARQAGNDDDYYAAPDVSQILTVSQPVPSDYQASRYAVATNTGIVYRATNDYKGALTNLAFDLYRRTNVIVPPQPVIIMIHGGGYNASSADRTQSYIVSLGNQLAARGFQALSIDYRLRATADRTNDGLQLPALRDAAADTLEAVKFVRANGTNYGWDTNAIFVLGGSAGGRIAAWLAVRESGDQGGLPTEDPRSTTTPDPSSVTSDATADYNNRSGMVASAVLFGGPEMSFRAYTVGASDLPCIMIHGTYDGNTAQTGSIDTYGSVDLYNQLIEVGVPSELHLLNGYGHQFDTSSGANATVGAIPTAADLTARFFIKQWERKLAGGTEAFSPIVSKAGGATLTLQAPVIPSNAPGTTYQWKRQGVGLSGETNSSLSIPNLQASHNGSYTVELGNPDRSWSNNLLSSLSFSNTPISGVNYVKSGQSNIVSHPTTLSLEVATVAVPSFVMAYPGESATSDVDGDGWLALAEYALGWSAALGNDGKGAVLPVMSRSNNQLVLNYQVRTNDPKVTVVPENSGDLVSSNWVTSNVSVSNLGVTNVGGETLQRRSASVPIDGDRKFLRLRVNQSP